MKNILLIVLSLFATVVFAQEIAWEKDFKTAIDRAAKEQKPMMFLLSKHGCRWCVHFEKNTLSDPRVITMLNENFISYVGFASEGGFPRELLTGGTPATWFISPQKVPMFQPIMGSMEPNDYLKALNIVLEQVKKDN